MKPYDFLKERSKIEYVLVSENRLLQRVMWMRLGSFLLGGILAAVCFTGNQIGLGILLVFVTIGTFLGLVVWYNKIKEEIEALQCKIKVLQRYINRRDRQWEKMHDKGEEFLTADHPYAGDLDIFGEQSLYQWISVAYTQKGRKALATLLTNPMYNKLDVDKRQEAVQELATHVDFSVAFQTEGEKSQNGRYKKRALDKYMTSQTRETSIVSLKWIHRLGLITSIGFILSLLGGVLDVIDPIIPGILFIVQLIIGRVGKAYSDGLGDIDSIQKGLEHYMRRLQLLEEEPFESRLLSELMEKMTKEGIQSTKAIKQIQRIGYSVDLSHNPVIYLLLNSFLQWDLNLSYAMELWEKKYKSSLGVWMEVIGDIEALMSLSVIGQIHPDWTYPTIVEGQQEIEAQELGHPLLNSEETVLNPVHMDAYYTVITGSNMSGKTTYLRTIGINMVLAYCGAPIMGKAMQLSCMGIYTSMRINDNLLEGISTFHAELLRIKMIIEASKDEKPMIYLIDEIFRGTNSVDRIIGAKSVLLNLNKPWVRGLMSTHDFELCDLVDKYPKVMVNKHFTEEYEEDTIRFDYRIREGRSRTTNAKHLMRLVGIELVSNEA